MPKYDIVLPGEEEEPKPKRFPDLVLPGEKPLAPPPDEQAFQQAYATFAAERDINPNPDDPKHFYDYRKAFAAGELKSDPSGHSSSKFKLEGHPRTYINPQDESQGSATPQPGWMDTRTGQIVNGGEKKFPDLVLPGETAAPPERDFPPLTLPGEDKDVQEGVWDILSSFGPGLKHGLQGVIPTIKEKIAGDIEYSPKGLEPPKEAFSIVASPLSLAWDFAKRVAKTYAPEAVTEIKEEAKAQRKAIEAAGAETLGPKPSITKQAVYSAGQSIGQNVVPGIVAIPFGGLPSSLVAMGTLTAFDTELRALDAGLSKKKAELAGTIDGIIEAGTELLPLKNAFKVGNPFLKKLVTFMITDYAGEHLATLLQDTNDYLMIHPEMTQKEYVDRLKHNLLVTAIATPLASGVQVTGTHLAQQATMKAVDALQKNNKTRDLTVKPGEPTPDEAMKNLLDEVEQQSAELAANPEAFMENVKKEKQKLRYNYDSQKWEQVEREVITKKAQEVAVDLAKNHPLEKGAEAIERLVKEIGEDVTEAERAAERPTSAQLGETELSERQTKTRLDKFNKFLDLSAPLEIMLNKINPHVPGALPYLHGTRGWWREKTAVTSRANDFLYKQWNKSVKRKEAVDFSAYLVEADVRSDAAKRALTAEEKQKIIEDKGLKLSPQAIEFAEKVWAEYNSVLDRAEAAVAKEIKATIQHPVIAATELMKYHNTFEDLRNRNFMPHSHFGQYAIEVKAKKKTIFEGKEYLPGQTMFFQTFESRHLRDKALKTVASDFSSDDVQVNGKYKLDDRLRMFQGLPQPLVNLLAKQMELTPQQMEQLEVLQHEMSAGARFAKKYQTREGIPGYSHDSRRVFAEYFVRLSNHAARLAYNPSLQRAIREMERSIETDFPYGADSTKRGQLTQSLKEHYEYLNDPGNELANLRALGFTFFLGFNPKSALVNLSQVPFVSYPHLAAKYGDVASVGALSKSIAKVSNVFKGKSRFSTDELAMFDELIVRNALNQGFATELGAASEGSQLQRITAGRFVGSEKAAASVRALSDWAGVMFGATEKYNRYVTSYAAYTLARQAGKSHADAVNEAHESVISTQLEYARYNRPKFMRGKKSALFLFWQYINGMGYFIGTDPGRWRYIAMLLAAGGLSALPGAENIMDLVDFALTKMKEKTGWKDPKVSSRIELRKLINLLNENQYTDLLVPDNPDLAMHGLSRNIGGFDLSGSVSMGRPLPMTEGLSVEQSADKAIANTVESASGALGSIAFSIYHALASDEPGVMRTTERMLPPFLKGPARAYRYATTEKETDRKGGTIAEFEPDNWAHRVEIAGSALNFPISRINAEREKRFLSNDVINYYAARRNVLFAELKWAKEQGPEEFAAAKEAVKNYNKDVPHPTLRITGDDLLNSLTQREISQRKSSRGLPVGNRQVPFYRELTEQFEPPANQ